MNGDQIVFKQITTTTTDNPTLEILGVAGCSPVPCWLYHPQTCLSGRQTAGSLWCPSGVPTPVFQRTLWLQMSGQQACSNLFLWRRVGGWCKTIVERLKHEGTSHSSSHLMKISRKMEASWSAQSLWHCLVLLPSWFSVKELTHIVFTDPECRWGSVERSDRGWRWMSDVGAGEEC